MIAVGVYHRYMLTRMKGSFKKWLVTDKGVVANTVTNAREGISCEADPTHWLFE